MNSFILRRLFFFFYRSYIWLCRHEFKIVNSLFDTFQVAEARSFITKRWQPPNSLTTALEYSLLVGADGTIERIEPLNKAARDYVDRSGLPLIDFPFCFS